MTEHRTLRLIAISTLIALLAVVFLAVNVSAHTLTPTKAVSSAVPSASFSVSITGAPAVFKPSKLNVHVGDTVTVTNNTKKTQSITYMGNVVITLAPGQSQKVTASIKGKAVFGLKSNSKAKLTVTVS